MASMVEMMDGARIRFAPWSQEEVELLNKMQHMDTMHPYTCGNRHCSHQGSAALVATRIGWTCDYCDYRQDWVHDPHQLFAQQEAMQRLVAELKREKIE